MLAKRAGYIKSRDGSFSLAEFSQSEHLRAGWKKRTECGEASPPESRSTR